ncbi:DUF11 domain-containing protein [Aureibaculum marinum]|uniref:DUF11 domain-containing protein n=1 Tax=Aureibaculum marinum TaxID=2487930 RepID=A0A3N4N0C3_9FLAO|nr:DUF11 domain-containing protein [Aureibaculum marinum]RPD89702.1 DUF11 domain-containing protein [Aureibaculum marinum]
MKKIKFILVIIIFFAIGKTFAQSIAVTPGTDLPAEVIACGESATFKFRVYGPTVANEKIEVQLPLESEFLGLVSPASGVTVDATDFKKPIFNIVNALAGPSNFIDIEYSVLTGCTIVLDPELTHTLVSNPTISKTVDYPTIQYSVLEVNSAIVPSSASLNVNETQNFTFTIGNDPVSTNAYSTNIYAYITHSTNVEVTYSGSGVFIDGSGSPSGGMITSIIVLGPSDIATVGDNDNKFEKNESIDITIAAKLLGCPLGAGETITYRAGYGGCLAATTACLTGNESTSGIALASGAPDLHTEVVKKAWPSPSNSDTAEFLFRNDGTGSGDIHNLTFDLGFSNGGAVYIPSDYVMYSWSNFSVNGTTVANSGAQGSFTDFNFTTDPDGPGVGLEDLDGDGIYNDLPVGHSFVLTNELTYNYLVDTGNGTECDAMNRGYSIVRWAYSYTTSCGNSNSQNVPNNSLNTWRPWSFYNMRYSSFVENSSSGSSNFVPGDTFDFRIQQRSNPSISTLNIPGMYWEIHYTLPSGISPNGNGTWGGQPLNLVSYNSTTGVAIYSSNSAPTNYKTNITHDPIIPLQVDTACSGSFVGSIEYEYHLIGDATYEPVDLCGTGPTFTVACGGSGPSVCVSNFSFDRTTFGYTDNTETTPVTAATPGVRTDHALEGDMVRWHVEVDVNENDLTFLNALLEYDTKNWFGTQADGGIKAINIEYQPSGGGASTISTNLGQYNYIEDNSGKTNHIVDLHGGDFSSINIGAGDKFIIDVDLKVSEEASITDTFFEKLTGILVSSPAESLSNPTRHTCNYLTEEFGVLEMRTTPSTDLRQQSTTFDGCGVINTGVRYNISNYSKEGDLFPNEFRNFGHVRRADILVPIGVDYVPGSSFYVPYPNQFVQAIGDPIITYNYEPGFNRYTWVNSGTWQKGKESLSWGIKEIRFQVVPNCNVDEWSYSGDRFGITILPTSEVEYFRNVTNPGRIVNPVRRAIPRPTQYIPLTYTVTSPTATVTTDTNTATWIVNINNTSSGGGILNNTWIAIEVPNDNIVPTLWSGGTEIPLTDYGTGKYWAQLGDITASGEQLEIRSNEFTVCGTDTFNVTVGQNCSSYPTDPDTGYPLSDGSGNYICNTLTIPLTLSTQEPSVNVSTVLGVPPASYDFCAIVPYEIAVNNAANGYAYKLSAEIRLPVGMILDNTSGVLMYDGTAYSVDQAQVTYDAPTNTYTVDISGISSPISGTNGLPGVSASTSNQFELIFDTSFDCDYVSGSKIGTQIIGESSCGAPLDPSQGQSEIKTNPVNVTQVPSDINYAVDVTSTDNLLQACGQTEVIDVNIFNQGVVTDGSIETIVATIDDAFNYVSGSFIAGVNSPSGEPTVTVNSVTGERVLTWTMPNGVASGSSISFSFEVEVVSPEEVSCTDYDLNVSTRVEQFIDCSSTGGVSCPAINSITAQEDEQLTIEKSTLSISSASTNSVVNGGNLEISAGFSLENTSAIDLAAGTVVSAYDDVNNNGSYDAGDVLLKSKTLTNPISAGSSVDDTIDFSVAIARGCNIILVVNTTNNPCICDITETSIGCNADLSLRKVVDNSNPDQGDNITFTLTVTNSGTSAPSNIVVKDIIPTDFTYNHPNFSTPQGTVTFTGGELEWDLGGFVLPVGDSISLTYTVTVDNCGEFVNQAEITNSSLNDPDSTPNNGN